MGVVIMFMLVGGIMGFGCAALCYQRQIDQVDSLKRVIRQNAAGLNAADQIIQAQKAQIDIQTTTIQYARNELSKALNASQKDQGVA